MRRPALFPALALVATGLAGCEPAEQPQPAVVTIALTAPELALSAFEPHLSIDPVDPRRMIVAAHYPSSPANGGRKIWYWASEDGGRTWAGRSVPVPRPDAIVAADPVTGFDATGRALVSFLFADSTSRGGLAIAASAPDDLALGPATVAVTDDVDGGGGPVDKDWLAVDRSRTSPFMGSVYLSYHYVRPVLNRTVQSTLWVRRRDGGGRWLEPTRVGPNFSGQIAVRSNGTVDAVFIGGNERSLLHAASDDGGASFGAVDTVVALSDSIGIDEPTVTVLPGDTVISCWNEGPVTRMAGSSIGCARKEGAGGWSVPTRLPTRPGGTIGYPGITSNGSGLWLLGYHTDSAATTVELHRSTDGGRTFTLARTLATRAFGSSRFCAAPRAPCRRDPARYFPGDYLGLASSGDQVVAAYALPETDDPASRSIIHVSIVRP